MKDNRLKEYIYFLMEKKEISIFYLGIAEGEVYSGGRKGKKTGLPIKRLKDRLEYPGGCLQIFFALLPEFEKRVIGKRGKKAWSVKGRKHILERTLLHVQEQGTYDEILLSPELDKKEERIPLELWAAHLYQHAPLQKVCIAFSKEGDLFEGREAILLLAPYLKRIHQVVLTGRECAAEDMFSDYLYYEYGIIPERIPESRRQNFSSGMRTVQGAEKSKEAEWSEKVFGESRREEETKKWKRQGAGKSEEAEWSGKVFGGSRREEEARKRKRQGAGKSKEAEWSGKAFGGSRREEETKKWKRQGAGKSKEAEWSGKVYRESRSMRAGSVVLLDFGSREEENADIGTFWGEYLYINGAETLKFLDTTIKNGYNTES